MELEVAFLPDGSVRVRVPDGQAGIDFEAAKRKIQQIQAELGAAGMPITWEGDIERHTHGPGATHTHTRAQAR